MRGGYVPSGTGPRAWEGEGITASVSDIISRIDANDPRGGLRAELTRLVLSSSITSRGTPGFDARANVASDSRATGPSDRVPGRRARHVQ